MARRRRSVVEAAQQDDLALQRRLTNLIRGATCCMSMENGSAAYGVERAAFDSIAAADDPRRSLANRVAAREELLGRMGRLDQALRHVAAMERSKAR